MKRTISWLLALMLILAALGVPVSAEESITQPDDIPGAASNSTVNIAEEPSADGSDEQNIETQLAEPQVETLDLPAYTEDTTSDDGDTEEYMEPAPVEENASAPEPDDVDTASAEVPADAPDNTPAVEDDGDEVGEASDETADVIVEPAPETDDVPETDSSIDSEETAADEATPVVEEKPYVKLFTGTVLYRDRYLKVQAQVLAADTIAPVSGKTEDEHAIEVLTWDGERYGYYWLAAGDAKAIVESEAIGLSTSGTYKKMDGWYVPVTVFAVSNNDEAEETTADVQTESTGEALVESTEALSIIAVETANTAQTAAPAADENQPENAEESAVEADVTDAKAVVPPVSVTNVVGNPVDTNAVRITWDAMPNVTGYQLFRATSQNGSYTWIKNNPTPAVNNYSLTPGTTYWYKVRAYVEKTDGSKVYGTFSKPISVHVLGKINNFTVQGKDTNCALLKWDRVEGCTGYQVFRTVAGTGEYTWVKNATTAQVANYSLKPGTTYYYKLRSYIDLPNGTRAYGQFSEGKQVIIMGQVQISKVSYAAPKMTVAWEKLNNITGYQVFYKMAGVGDYVWKANVTATGTTWSQANLPEGRDYYYKMRTYRDNPDGTRCYGQFSEARHCVINGFTHEVENGRATIVGYLGTATALKIPEKLSGGTVVAISAEAFKDRKTIKSVTFPATLETIGESAFQGCTGITEISLPDKVTIVSDHLFEGCTALKRVHFSPETTEIGENAFNGCTALAATY